ncbi:MAG: NADH-quinone oxidoreductase subunit C [Candidatus Neomarinimicrobiota bacterium]
MEQSQIIAKVASVHPEALIPTEEEANHIRVIPEHWLVVAQFLRSDPDLHFDSLMCLTGYDPGPGEPLGVAYNLHSMDKLHQLEVRIEVPREGGTIPSVAHIWRTADWHEREAYDMFGVIFEGHPDPRRMLLPEDWEGHPLRKDYTTPDYYRGIPVPKDKRGWE